MGVLFVSEEVGGCYDEVGDGGYGSGGKFLNLMWRKNVYEKPMDITIC